MKIRVLVVEDHPVAQKIAQLILNSLKCEVCICENGETAIKLFSENQYDLVFMDIGLPDKDGFSVVKEMRKLEAKNSKTKTLIVGLSVHTGVAQQKQALKSGMDDYIVKPLSLKICNELLTKLVVSDNLGPETQYYPLNTNALGAITLSL